jgi:predicted PilT family ATPase
MPKHDDILDRPILSLSESDHLRLRDLVEGVLITGAPGSGKTTTSGKQLAFALLNAGRPAGAKTEGGR